MVPNAAYAASVAAGLVTVSQSGGGAFHASMSGVLTFSLAPAVGPMSYYTVPPCRLLDTRDPAGPHGGPSLASGAVRTIGAAGSCGIPAGARAIATNVTVVAGGSAGYLTAFADGETAPLASMINFRAGQVRASNAIVKLSAAGNAAVVAGIGAGQVDLVLDVSGYFR